MPTEVKVIAVIPARWASSRFPGKPIEKILGKPMIQWVVEQAEKARLVQEALVATDDPRILEVARGFGAEALMTSPDHPSGTDRIVEVVRDRDCDIVVNVQGDEPFMPPENIDLAVEALLKEPDAGISTLMIPIYSKAEMFDPHTTKVVVDQKGRALYFSRAPIPFRRDEWPGLNVEKNADPLPKSEILGYKHIGLYAYKKSFLMEFPRLRTSRYENVEKLEQLRILESGYPILVTPTDRDSLGVDCREDLVRAEEIARERLKN